jgi:hypothetical protein
MNMNKIAQPLIRRRRVVCLFMSSTSCGASSQEYELYDLSPLSALQLSFLLYGLRTARTWNDVQSVVLVRANTLINEASVVTDGETLK